MNAVEIEEAVSALAEQPFDAEEFPYLFLLAFGNKDTTIKRLRAAKGSTNASDIPGALLQRNNIHIATCPLGEVTRTLTALRDSPATSKAKAKFILATDGETFEAEELDTGETVACAYADFPNHFGAFLPLAGITTVKQIRESSFDIRATSKLNRLYVELLKDNPDWGTADRRHDMNHFMARLIFCFFAEDTDIFQDGHSFTNTVDTMTERDSSNTHEVIGELFRAMNTPTAERKKAGIARYADRFPYVNGGLFSGSPEVPRFSKIARSYLIHIGALDWTKINPDIFGSMIQAVADDEERGALGMHYTSVPNILKVLNPLFLDDLRARLNEAGDNARMLLNLRKRTARIRVFDPACGSGNFLVIAYKEMRAIEAEINSRRGEADRPSEIPLTNFRGIELRDFPAEIARLALIIAEFQCDVLYRGQKLALAEFLPLNAENWITCGNALRLDWLSICPPTGTGVKHSADDLFHSPLDQPHIDFENEGGETYICGNPPYLGKGKLDTDQQSEMAAIFGGRTKHWGYIDYVGAWFLKAADYCRFVNASAALVATNSVCMGRQAPTLWPLVLSHGIDIRFAHTSFSWSNSATNKAAVFCVIVGIDDKKSGDRILVDGAIARKVDQISPYLTAGFTPLVKPTSNPISPELSEMVLGNMPNDGGALSLSFSERELFYAADQRSSYFIRRFYGSKEYNNDLARYCLWISDKDLSCAEDIDLISDRLIRSREIRLRSPDASNRKLADRPHQMREFNQANQHSFIVPRMTSERRQYLPCGVLPASAIISSQAFSILDADFWNLSILLSRLHFVWVATICGKFKEDYRYSSDLGWNTFPVPTLTDKMKADLTRCAEDILLAREAHFPATIAELYDPEKMPADLREAHERNDEVLERIYIGRCFRNDTERLEKLFDLYTKMTAKTGSKNKKKAGAA
ncbi:lactate dehydrogenase [Komagataeibacter rhaeticus]|uniref:class I SAM-dependent DNA methyltransferase n=1 Tax=Komagataeibacter rhaeticus TaxID=215221 RepID=UPI000D88BC96|nr:DNA methyltransferase [Komagataeibacter rhaeticus]PYD53573.1 lactate dehydrogenase [Komagataeibacter rhaeticus]GBQ10877.1 DNA methylase [Komagataeibacter rhaeticus DSM 16663]